MSFAAVIEDVELEDGTDHRGVQLLFWADLAASHVAPGATFEIWFGEVVGKGQVLNVTSVPVLEARESYDLTNQERQLLMSGINEWGGPSRCNDSMARAMGFESVKNLFEETVRVREHLRLGEAMSTSDWARVLGATEVCFSSSIGSRTDWSVTTGFSDHETIELLRGLQHKLIDVSEAMRGGDLF